MMTTTHLSGYTLLFFLMYWLPTIIAKSKRRSNVLAIFALNFLLGWTILGWVGALIWALTNAKPAQA